MSTFDLIFNYNCNYVYNYRPYSTSPPATPKKQAPPLSSPASSVGGFSTQSYSHMPLTSTGAPQYSPVPYYPYAKENNEVSPSGNIAIKSEVSSSDQ